MNNNQQQFNYNQQQFNQPPKSGSVKTVVIIIAAFAFFLFASVFVQVAQQVNKMRALNAPSGAKYDQVFFIKSTQMINGRVSGKMSAADAASAMWNVADKNNISPTAFLDAVSNYRSSDGTADTAISMLTIVAENGTPCNGDIEDWSNYLKFVYDESTYDEAEFRQLFYKHLDICKSSNFVMTIGQLGYLNNGINALAADMPVYYSRSKFESVVALNQFQWNLNNSNKTAPGSGDDRTDYILDIVKAFAYDLAVNNNKSLNSSLNDLRDRREKFSSYRDALVKLIVLTSAGDDKKMKALGFKKPESQVYLSSFKLEYDKGLAEFKDPIRSAEHATRVSYLAP